MPSKVDKYRLAPSQDRRRKLTEEQRRQIADHYATGGYSLNTLARLYDVSKKTVLLIVNPRSAERAKQYHAEHWSDFKETKEQHAASVRRTRQYKKELLLKGELKGGSHV